MIYTNVYTNGHAIANANPDDLYTLKYPDYSGDNLSNNIQQDFDGVAADVKTIFGDIRQLQNEIRRLSTKLGGLPVSSLNDNTDLSDLSKRVAILEKPFHDGVTEHLDSQIERLYRVVGTNRDGNQDIDKSLLEKLEEVHNAAFIKDDKHQLSVSEYVDAVLLDIENEESLTNLSLAILQRSYIDTLEEVRSLTEKVNKTTVSKMDRVKYILGTIAQSWWFPHLVEFLLQVASINNVKLSEGQAENIAHSVKEIMLETAEKTIGTAVTESEIVQALSTAVTTGIVNNEVLNAAVKDKVVVEGTVAKIVKYLALAPTAVLMLRMKTKYQPSYVRSNYRFE